MAYGKNAPFGLKPYASALGGPWVPQLNEYLIGTTADGQTTYAGNIFTGDPVFLNSGTTNNLSGTIANQVNAAATPLPVGVFQGCEYYDVNNILQKKTCWIGSTRIYPGTSIKAYVIDDPFVIWDIQVSTANNTLADAVAKQSWIGENVKIAVAGGGNNLVPNNPATGNLNTGVSAYYLDGSSVAGADNEKYPLKIIRFTPIPQNYQTIGAADGQGNTFNTRPFLNMLVMFNAHYTKSDGTTGPHPE